MTSDANNTVRILSLLDSYQTLHEEASGHLKDSLWNLTKARHSKAAGHCQEDLVASQVRQDVRPRIVLLLQQQQQQLLQNSKNEPSLLHEDDTQKIDDKNASRPIPFVLVDPVEEELKRRSADAGGGGNEDDKTLSSSVKASGLRQRKKTSNKPGATESPTAAWSIIQEESYNGDDEEARLRKVDPLELFGGGLNPRTLQVAQEEAKQALELYVRAVNLKRFIEFELKRHSSKK